MVHPDFIKNNNKDKTTGYILLFLAGLSWGMIGLFTNGLSSSGLNSIEISFLRQLFAFLEVFAIVLCRYGFRSLRVDRTSLFLLALQGCVVTTLFCIFYALTIQILGVATAVVMMYLAPVFVIVISALFFGERITVLKILAIAVNLAGCYLSASKGEVGALKINRVGLLCGVLSGLGYALVSIFGKIFSNRGINSFVSVLYINLFSVVTLSVLAFFNRSGTPLLQGRILLNGFGIGLFGSALAYLFYYSGMKRPVNLSTAPVVASVEVVLGSMIGIFVFGETCNSYVVIGMILVVMSIVIISIAENKKRL